MKSHVPFIRESLKKFEYEAADEHGYPLSSSHPYAVGIMEAQPIDNSILFQKLYGIPDKYQVATLHLKSSKYAVAADSN